MRSPTDRSSTGVLDASDPAVDAIISPSGGPAGAYDGSGAPGSSTPQMAFFTLQYTEAEEIAEPIRQAFGSTLNVAVYPQENRLVFVGDAAMLRAGIDMVRQLDRPRPQVRITALIYDVGLNEIKNIGLNLNRQVAEATTTGTEVTESLSDFFHLTGDLTNGTSSIGLRTLRSSYTSSALLECIQSDGEAKLLADPSITVGDRHDASIRIVRRVPIITANPIQGSDAVFTQTQFEEAGVILVVRPRISRDGTIELSVQPEFSVVSELTESGPVIDSRTADTVVRVVDGEMFVLGGLRQKTIVESVRGIPFLKDVKHIGRLFRGHSTEVRESELIVFLRPEIIHPGACPPQRAAVAHQVATDYLDRIPYAENIPLTPCCRDPNCPNHHPRIRINGGMPGGGMIDSDAFGVDSNAFGVDTTLPYDPMNRPTRLIPPAMNSSAPIIEPPITSVR